MTEIDFDGIYDALRVMDVQLDPDPIQYGPKRLNGKVAESRAQLSKCESIFLDLSQELSRVKRESRLAEADFNLQMKHLLANDPEVRAGRNLKDREAIATMKLEAEHRKINDLTLFIEEVEACLTVIKAKRSDLKDIQGRLRDQIKLIQEEINLGTKWGNLEAQAVELIPGKNQAIVSGFVKKSPPQEGRAEIPLPIFTEPHLMTSDMIEEAPNKDDSAEAFCGSEPQKAEVLPNSNNFSNFDLDDILEDFDF